MDDSPHPSDVDAVAAAVQHLQRLGASRQAHAALAAASGVDLPQQAMHLLVRLDSARTSSDLAREARMDPGAVSREVARLEQAGFVTRVTGQSPRGAVEIELTPRGHDARMRVMKIRGAHLERALQGWTSADALALAELLERFVIDLQASPLRPPDR